MWLFLNPTKSLRNFAGTPPIAHIRAFLIVCKCQTPACGLDIYVAHCPSVVCLELSFRAQSRNPLMQGKCLYQWDSSTFYPAKTLRNFMAPPILPPQKHCVFLRRPQFYQKKSLRNYFGDPISLGMTIYITVMLRLSKHPPFTFRPFTKICTAGRR